MNRILICNNLTTYLIVLVNIPRKFIPLFTDEPNKIFKLGSGSNVIKPLSVINYIHTVSEIWLQKEDRFNGNSCVTIIYANKIYHKVDLNLWSQLHQTGGDTRWNTGIGHILNNEKYNLVHRVHKRPLGSGKIVTISTVFKDRCTLPVWYRALQLDLSFGGTYVFR